MSPTHARETPSLARHLLCAVPQLLDPNFHRSVVLMLEHGSDGALGLVLNHPMPTTLREVAESLELDWAGDPEARVRFGGPVDPVRGWILHDQAKWDPEAEPVAPGLWLTTSLDPMVRSQQVRFGGDEARFVFLLGYAGWGGGQLEAEIATGSWVLVPVVGDEEEAGTGVSVDFLLDTPPEQMWKQALEAIGVDPQRLVGLQGNQTLH